MEQQSNRPVKAKKKKKKPSKQIGRKRKKREFEETRVGHFIKHEAPLEYGLILDVAGTVYKPSADLIEAIGYASTNPLFRKQKFRRSLIEYRKTGLYSGKPMKSNVNTELYYMRVRKSQNISK
jgi:hypothetical protein